MAKILILSNTPGVIDLDHGGKQRSYNLAKALLKKHEVTFLAIGWNGENFDKCPEENLRVVSIAVEPSVMRLANSFKSRLVHKSSDLMMAKFAKHMVNYPTVMNSFAQESDLIIIDHAAMAPMVEQLRDYKNNIFYLSHNSEMELARQLYQPNSLDMKLTHKLENIAFSQSVAFGYCSEEDFKNIKKDFDPSIPGYYVPSGTNIPSNITPGSNYNSKKILYVGSAHPPNNVAVQNILKVAKSMPEYKFLIGGNASMSINDKNKPENVEKLGYLDPFALDNLFKSVFAFINPIEQGSGTHLKILEALGYGLPIITSEIGSRGFTEEQKEKSMVIANSTNEFVDAIGLLSNKNLYDKISKNAYELGKQYSWDAIQENYLKIIDSLISNNKQVKTKAAVPTQPKEKVLIYSIIRNEAGFMDRYHSQLQKIVQTFPNYEFYLSIYENDSNDGTKQKIFSKDWSFFNKVSIISENINTKDYGAVKDGDRVKNLSIARNRAIEANEMLDKVDYVMMIESDFRFNMHTVKQILDFKDIEPDFHIVSAISIRNGHLYDAWATRKKPQFEKGVPVLHPNYKNKPYDKYYSTSNGICLYRAKPFQEGARYGWINTVTGEADCDTVVVCQDFIERGYDNIYILHNAEAYHQHR